MVFEHEPHGRTGTMLLKPNEELVETLEDNQVHNTQPHQTGLDRQSPHSFHAVPVVHCRVSFEICPLSSIHWELHHLAPCADVLPDDYGDV